VKEGDDKRDVKEKRFLVIGGAGLIGPHTVDPLSQEDVKEILIYYNFTRGGWKIFSKL